ncbi:MAG: GLUG motif-containing protein [Leptothrix sp. (in: b-proteobacteria)]
MQHASLNHIYRVVWSLVLNAWIAVSEITRGRGKSSSRQLVAAALSLTAALAQAAPSGGQITVGAGSISQSGNTTTVQQASQNLSLNWNSFNIAPQETVNFLQPSASALAVNRIFDTNGTQILGHLNANGQIYLINPNGILFGQGAQVNVGGLVAASLDVNDASLGGTTTRSFSGKGSGSVINQGTIHAADGGYVALLGNQVSNQGVITARLGTVALGAGSAATLTFSGDSLVHLQVDQSVLGSLAANGGLLQADGGQVLMSAGAKNTLLASVVNNTGVIEARTVDNRDGTIVLLGGMQAGQVNVGGTLDASAPHGGNGGFIETSAAHVKVANDSRVSTAAAAGKTGTWLIDPQDYTVAASGGDISGTTLSNNLASTNVTLQSSSGGTAGSGDININDAVSWSANTLTLTAANNVNINAVMTATGSASLAMNPATANGADAAVAGGTVNVALGPNGFTGRVDFSGSGTLSINGTPYTVINSLGTPGSTTGTDLQGMWGNLSGHYVLGSNIDASATAAWNGGAGFNPIGVYYNPYNYTTFNGIFDGLGHIVSGLTINQPSSGGSGLFAQASGTVAIRNVGLDRCNVTGGFGAGGLVGGTWPGSLISNTYVTGTVTATGFANGGSDGGLVGFSRSTIRNSYSTATVSGLSSVGGLVGSNLGPLINSYATGNVTATRSVGGLIGDGNGPITNSYATGAVTGNIYVGGLAGGISGPVANSYATGAVNGTSYVGGLVAENISTISNSYATGNATASGDYVGGLVAENVGTIDSSHATGNATGANYIGGLVGVSHDYAAISNSYATGSVSGATYVGGLVGTSYINSTVSNSYATISNSYATGAVTGTSHVAGLAAFNSGTITNSYATGNASANGDYIGGLVAENVGTIDGSHATGNATGTNNTVALNYIGGLVGNNHTNGTISNSYAMGDASGDPYYASYVGGLVGLNDTSGTVVNSYAQGNVSGLSNLGGLVGGSNGQIINSHYNVDALTIRNNHTLTRGGLYNAQYQDWQNHGLSLDISNYAGSLPYDVANGYYLIGNVQGLKDFLGFADHAGYKFRLSGNIDLSTTPGLWIPYFSATEFDGAGHVISNLNVSLLSTGVGMFGELSSTSAITNLGIANGSVFALHSVGGLVGVNRGTVSNSYAAATVSEVAPVHPPAPADSAGGLVGDNFGTVSNSYATGTVSGGNAIGGLVGYNAGAVVNSYATASVSGTTNLGGAVGQSIGSINNVFWNPQTSGQATSAGGTGLTSAQMQQQANFTSATAANGNVNPNWDFTNTWVMYEGQTYPLLRVFMTPLTVTANNASKAYDQQAYSGGNGVSYSTTPNANLLGRVSYGGNSQGATDTGSYAITPGGLYSNQQGYIISYADGTLTISTGAVSPPADTRSARVQGEAAVPLSYLRQPNISGPENSGSGGGYTTSMGAGAVLNTKMDGLEGMNYNLRVEKPGVRLPEYTLNQN